MFNIKTLRKFCRTTPYFILITFFFLNVVFAVCSSGVLPGGIKIFTNKSYSMAPVITPGSLTLVKNQPMNTYNPGDIISFYRQVDGTEEIITHRIWRLGGNTYITKGDSNQAVDSQPVLPRLVIGKIIFIIPYLGYWISILKTSIGTIFFILIPCLFIIASELAYIDYL